MYVFHALNLILFLLECIIYVCKSYIKYHGRQVYVYMYVCMYICMYVCMYVYRQLVGSKTPRIIG